MPRYIEEGVVYGLFDQSGRASLHVGDIDVLPRADAVEVVHGRWRLETDEEEPNLMFKLVVCSVCGKTANGMYNYCPN